MLHQEDLNVAVSLLVGVPVIWTARNFSSNPVFSRGQRLFCLTGVLTYLVALFVFSVKLLWQGMSPSTFST